MRLVLCRSRHRSRATERKALAFLLGRFCGRVLKGGEHLVPEAALEALAEQNIHFTVKGKASYEQQVAAMHPLGRLGAPEDVALATLFLASDSSSWLTGITLDVAGGRIMV